MCLRGRTQPYLRQLVFSLNWHASGTRTQIEITNSKPSTDRQSGGNFEYAINVSQTLEATALDPTTVPGWTHVLEGRPQDRMVLQEFLARLIKNAERRSKSNSKEDLR